jgi:hypothetical protein
VQHVEAAERLDCHLEHSDDTGLVRDIHLGDHRLADLPATRSAAVRLMSATTTDAPSLAIKRAEASPIPLPAPVTTATFPSRRPIGRTYQRSRNFPAHWRKTQTRCCPGYQDEGRAS